MARWCRDIIICFLLLVILSVLARNPGFKARITSKGLSYANQVAIEALKKNVLTLQIPDQNGKASGFKYWIKNIHVTDFNPPTSTIRTDTGAGLAWSASNAYIAVHGDFRYKKWFVSDSGSFDAKVSGVDFSLSINIGEDRNGRPTIAARSCNSNIGDVDFKFHGGMAWLYNLFRGKVGDIIKNTLNKQMCTLVNNAIDVDANKKLARLRVTTPLAKKFLLDYRLIQTPSFQTQYMETYHKGEIYWLSNPTTESPLVPPPMPANADTGSMLYLWVSDYMFDTIGYQAQKHGFLVYNMTQKDLPPSNRGVLNTTCEGFIPKCVGKLIPQIGQKYPDCVVDLQMNSTKAPVMKITPAGVNITCAGLIDLYARKPGKPGTSFLVSLAATMTTAVNVSIRNELIYAGINNLQLNLKVVRSAVGNISSDFLNFLVNKALKMYLIPQLNDLGGKGFPLPVTDEIKFKNTKVSFVQDTVLISTDLTYVASSEDAVDDISGPLKFKPAYPQYRNYIRTKHS